MSFTIKDVPQDASVTAQAALDALLDGDTPFTLSNGWSDPLFQPMAANKLLALVRLLRSDEPISDVIRAALADALDPTSDAPIRITARSVKRPRFATIAADLSKMGPLLDSYNLKREEGCQASDALAFAAREHGINEDKARRLLTSERANRKQGANVATMLKNGHSVVEIAKFITASSAKKPRRKK